MRPSDELYIGCWGMDNVGHGFLVSLDPPRVRDARTGVVRSASAFKRVPTDPNTPSELRRGSQGFYGGNQVTLTHVSGDGSIEYKIQGSNVPHAGLYASFHPHYASNH